MLNSLFSLFFFHKFFTPRMSQKIKTAAILVSQSSLMGVELFLYSNSLPRSTEYKTFIM